MIVFALFAFGCFLGCFLCCHVHLALVVFDLATIVNISCFVAVIECIKRDLSVIGSGKHLQFAVWANV